MSDLLPLRHYLLTFQGDRVVVSCLISNEEFNLTQYHVFQNGSSTIALGTYTLDNPQVGELRYLFRLQGLSGAYPTGNVSDTRDGTVIESKDIWKTEAGETRAKVANLPTGQICTLTKCSALFRGALYRRSDPLCIRRRLCVLHQTYPSV